MLKIRLRRTGATKQPRYRVVVAESRAPRDGAFVEILGWYNPQADPAQVVINTEKAAEWIQRGAQPSDRVAYLLKQAAAAPAPESMAASSPASAGAPASAPASKSAGAGRAASRSRSRVARAATETGGPPAASAKHGEADGSAAGTAGEVEASGAAAEVGPSEVPEEEGSAGSAS